MIAELDQRAKLMLPEADVRTAIPEGHLAPLSHRTLIQPALGWQLIDVRELWRYRELLFFLCWRDVKVRYKQTVLGAAWAVLQPLANMVVFTVFLGRMAGIDV